jgi:hypothetical protein
MWRKKDDFLLVALRDSLIRARLNLINEDFDGTMKEIDGGLSLIDTAMEIMSSPARFSVFNLKTLGSKQNALVLSNSDVLERALQVLEKYASVSYGRRKIEVDFHGHENWAIKQLFIELIAEKANAKCVRRSRVFSLSFPPARQMSLLGEL